MTQPVKEAYCGSMRNRIWTSSTHGQKAKNLSLVGHPCILIVEMEKDPTFVGQSVYSLVYKASFSTAKPSLKQQ